MQIQQINSYSLNQQRPNFKSAYPVIHWIAEANGSYSPVTTEKLTKKLQSKLVRYLNAKTLQGKNSTSPIANEANRYVRSFYNPNGGFTENSFDPLSYLITGDDVTRFDNELAKPIGRSKREAPRFGGKLISGELSMALGDYWVRGLNFVKRESKKCYGADGILSELHTKFRVYRTKTGKVKNIELVGLKFLPKEGPTNPFERLGYFEPKK